MRKIYFGTFLCLLFFPPLMGQETSPLSQNKFLSELSVSLQKKDASSKNKRDGELTINVTGGQAPYTITYFTPFQTSKSEKGNELTLKNLPVGDYIIVIQDAENKTIVKTTAIVGIN